MLLRTECVHSPSPKIILVCLDKGLGHSQQLIQISLQTEETLCLEGFEGNYLLALGYAKVEVGGGNGKYNAAVLGERRQREAALSSELIFSCVRL